MSTIVPISRLKDVPDVAQTTPTDGWPLVWVTSTSKWTPSATLSPSEIRFDGLSFARLGSDGGGGPYLGYNLKYVSGYKYDSAGQVAGISFSPTGVAIYAGGSAAANATASAAALISPTSAAFAVLVTASAGLTVTGAISGGSLTIAGYNTSTYTVRFGDYAIQNYALNNGFITDNAYYTGSSWTRINTGYAEGVQFFNGQVMLHTADTGSGTFTQRVTVKTDYTGKVGLGGNINVAAGNYTGASVLIDTTLILPVITDASIPNGGTAWSSDTPNTLKVRTPAGVLTSLMGGGSGGAPLDSPAFTTGMSLTGAFGPVQVVYSYTGAGTDGNSYTGARWDTAGGTIAYLVVTAPTYTVNGLFKPNGMYFQNIVSGGDIGIMARGGGDVFFTVGGYTAGFERFRITSTGATTGFPLTLGASVDGSIPNSGIAWSTTTANTLKARTPAGVLETLTGRAPLDTPTFTGTPAAPTATAGTATTQLATTAFVTNSPTFTGVPAAPTATAGTNTTQVATTAFVTAAIAAGGGGAPLASPAFTGVPTAPTATAGTSTTQLATTAFVTTADNLKAPLASPALTGTPTAPTATAGTATTQLATTAFVTNSPTFAGTVTSGAQIKVLAGISSASSIELYDNTCALGMENTNVVISYPATNSFKIKTGGVVSGTVRAQFDSNFNLGVGLGGLAIEGTVSAKSTSTTTTTMVCDTITSQTADLHLWRITGATTVARITAAGDMMATRLGVGTGTTALTKMLTIAHATQPNLMLNHTGAASDEKRWLIYTTTSPSVLHFAVTNDAESVNTDYLTIGRSGTTPTIALGGGTAIKKILSASAVLDFPSTATNLSSDLTVSVTGAAVGDVVSLGVEAAPPANTCYTGWVSAADTVTVRFNNYSAGAVDPGSQTYRVQVTKF
jgi:hypothetical protein